MIRLVTLDLYQTLCFNTPSRYERLAAICTELGFSCRADDFIAADVEAEELYTVENGRLAMHTRPREEQTAFYASMWAILLRGAGLPHDMEVAERVRNMMQARQSSVKWLLYEDVVSTLSDLRASGLKLGVISNTPTDATILCDQLGVCERVDFIVSSCMVGCEKPDRRVFEAALQHAGVSPEEAVHIGDQPRSDAIGAVSAGMHALLLDRRGLLAHEEYERIASLAEVPGWVGARVRRPQVSVA